MALADTGKAIGAVTRLLTDRLENHPKIKNSNITVTAGRPEPNDASGPKLNLFLYEALFDPSLKNISLDEGQPAPLWLVLKYLITAFDDGHSDTAKAHEYLGEGIRALQELNFLSLNTQALTALNDNPEPLKITFDEASSELLSKLMQGSDEKYRFSMSFQVRPVMIATSEPSSYSLLVGIDYTQSPSEVIGDDGVQIPVIPSLGPKITQISPTKFEVNETVTIMGNDLNISGLFVRLGSAELAVTAQQPNKLECLVNGSIGSGIVISAGSHPLSVVQILPTGRHRSSNLLVGDLLPTFDNSVFTPDLSPDIFGSLDMTGALLGTAEDDIVVALYKDGKIVKVFDAPFTFTPDQSSLTLQIENSLAVPPANYRVILRINGQQAKNSPEVELIV